MRLDLYINVHEALSRLSFDNVHYIVSTLQLLEVYTELALYYTVTVPGELQGVNQGLIQLEGKLTGEGRWSSRLACMTKAMDS